MSLLSLVAVDSRSPRSLLLLALAGCTTVDPSPSAAPTGSSASTVTTAEADPAAVLVDVGTGRSVSATCWGSGSPAVIYLHGMIMRGDGDEWTRAPQLQERIPPETTYCEYATGKHRR